MADKEFGVNDLAKHLGVQPATARVLLRNGKVKKKGRSYAWGSKTEMVKVAESVRPDEKPIAKKAKAKVKTKKKAVAKVRRSVEGASAAA